MRLVLDANILIGELLRSQGRARLARPGLALFLAEETWGEVRHELPKRVALLARRVALSDAEARGLLGRCFGAIDANVSIMPAAAYLPLEEEARWRIARDPSDWPTVALALALDASIWTEDRDFLGCGLPTWTTATLMRSLDGREQRSGVAEEE